MLIRSWRGLKSQHEALTGYTAQLEHILITYNNKDKVNMHLQVCSLYHSTVGNGVTPRLNIPTSLLQLYTHANDNEDTVMRR